MSVNTTPEHSHLTEQEQEQQTQEPGYVPKWSYEPDPEKIVLPTIGSIVYLFNRQTTKPFAGIVADVDGYIINVAAIGHLGESMGSLTIVPHVSSRQEIVDTWWWDWPPRQE